MFTWRTTNFIWAGNELPELQHHSAFSVVSRRSRLLVSVHSRVSLRTYIRRGECWWNFSVATGPHITLLQFERGAQPFCLAPQTKYLWQLCPFFLHTLHTFSHPFRITALLQIYWDRRSMSGLSKFQVVGCPNPHPHHHPRYWIYVKLWKTMWIVHCTIWSFGNYINIWFHWHHVLQSDVRMWQVSLSAMLLDIHCRPGVEYMFMSTCRGNLGNMGELTFRCSSHPHCAYYGNSLLRISQTHQNTTRNGIVFCWHHYFLINTDYPVLPAKFPFYPHIRVSGILIREIWDAFLVWVIR